MWTNLAAANGHKNSAELRDVIATQMTPADISEAQQMTSDWTKSNP